MKKLSLALLLTFVSNFSFSQNAEEGESQLDSIEKSFTYQHGTIALRNGIGSISIPAGFKYLDAKQSEHVIVDIWGNPRSADISMGMILPEDQGVMNGYAFNIEYDEIGYVKDDDADEIDYAELLGTMQKEAEEANAERKKQGYEPVTIVGWASPPFYDKERKILHWAKEIKFGNAEVNTLNYNIRILGRKGVLILNAIATTRELDKVKQAIPNVLDIVRFNEGYQYKDFDPSIDQVAAWTIGGLVAGKILAKVGIFALVAKFGKVIIFALLAFFAGFKNKIVGLFRRKKSEPVAAEVPVANQLTGSDSEHKTPGG